jgi:hypothetical protein
MAKTVISADVSKQATLQLRYKNLRTININLLDKDRQPAPHTGGTFTLEVHTEDYKVSKIINGVLSQNDTRVSFTFPANFWTGFKLDLSYLFRVDYAIGAEIMTYIDGPVTIS